MPNKKNKDFSLERALTELETIVNKLEQDGSNLQESLELFSKGIQLTKECQKVLQQAEQQVKLLVGEGLVDFHTEVADEDDDEDDLE